MTLQTDREPRLKSLFAGKRNLAHYISNVNCEITVNAMLLI